VRQFFQHFLFTRFNLPFKDRSRPDLTCERQWLRDRIDLFERWTLPSLRAQTCREFQYLVLFRDDSPDWFKSYVESNWGDIVQPMWEDPKKCRWCCRWKVKQFLRTQGEHEWVISTRIDNDDAISRDFVERLQSFIRPQAEWLFFATGILHSEISNLSSVVDYPSNPFPSRVEKRQEAEGCYEIPHHLIEQEPNVRWIPHDASWITVLHGSNLNDRKELVKKRWPLATPKQLARFAVNCEQSPYQVKHPA